MRVSWRLVAAVCSRRLLLVPELPRATCVMVFPLFVSRTASALNSGVNARRARPPGACCCFFFIEHSHALSRYPGCPPAGGKLTRPRVCFFGHHHTRVDAEVAGVQCVGLNKGHYPGCLVAFEMKPGERGRRVLGEWPPRPAHE